MWDLICRRFVVFVLVSFTVFPFISSSVIDNEWPINRQEINWPVELSAIKQDTINPQIPSLSSIHHKNNDSHLFSPSSSSSSSSSSSTPSSELSSLDQLSSDFASLLLSSQDEETHKFFLMAGTGIQAGYFLDYRRLDNYSFTTIAKEYPITNWTVGVYQSGGGLINPFNGLIECEFLVVPSTLGSFSIRTIDINSLVTIPANSSLISRTALRVRSSAGIINQILAAFTFTPSTDLRAYPAVGSINITCDIGGASAKNDNIPLTVETIPVTGDQLLVLGFNVSQVTADVDTPEFKTALIQDLSLLTGLPPHRFTIVSVTRVARTTSNNNNNNNNNNHRLHLQASPSTPNPNEEIKIVIRIEDPKPTDPPGFNTPKAIVYAFIQTEILTKPEVIKKSPILSAVIPSSVKAGCVTGNNGAISEQDGLCSNVVVVPGKEASSDKSWMTPMAVAIGVGIGGAGILVFLFYIFGKKEEVPVLNTGANSNNKDNKNNNNANNSNKPKQNQKKNEAKAEQVDVKVDA